jgi:hypothetical protein
MALSIREQKLVIAWRAERAISAALVKEFGKSDLKIAQDKRIVMLDPKILSGFSADEVKEIMTLDSLIPKE